MKARRIFLDHKSAHAAIVIFCPDNFDVSDRRCTDPAFAAIQNVMVTIASGAGFHPARIRAVPVFRQGKGTDAIAGYESWQPMLLLLRRPERLDRLNRERALH